MKLFCRDSKPWLGAIHLCEASALTSRYTARPNTLFYGSKHSSLVQPTFHDDTSLISESLPAQPSWDLPLRLQSALSFSQRINPSLYLAAIFVKAFLTENYYPLHCTYEFLIPQTELSILLMAQSLVGSLPGILHSPVNRRELLLISYCDPGAQRYLTYHSFPRE